MGSEHAATGSEPARRPRAFAIFRWLMAYIEPAPSTTSPADDSAVAPDPTSPSPQPWSPASNAAEPPAEPATAGTAIPVSEPAADPAALPPIISRGRRITSAFSLPRAIPALITQPAADPASDPAANPGGLRANPAGGRPPARRAPNNAIQSPTVHAHVEAWPTTRPGSKPAGEPVTQAAVKPAPDHPTPRRGRSITAAFTLPVVPKVAQRAAGPASQPAVGPGQAAAGCPPARHAAHNTVNLAPSHVSAPTAGSVAEPARPTPEPNVVAVAQPPDTGDRAGEFRGPLRWRGHSAPDMVVEGFRVPKGEGVARPLALVDTEEHSEKLTHAQPSPEAGLTVRPSLTTEAGSPEYFHLESTARATAGDFGQAARSLRSAKSFKPLYKFINGSDEGLARRVVRAIRGVVARHCTNPLDVSNWTKHRAILPKKSDELVPMAFLQLKMDHRVDLAPGGQHALARQVSFHTVLVTYEVFFVPHSKRIAAAVGLLPDKRSGFALLANHQHRERQAALGGQKAVEPKVLNGDMASGSSDDRETIVHGHQDPGRPMPGGIAALVPIFPRSAVREPIFPASLLITLR